MKFIQGSGWGEHAESLGRHMGWQSPSCRIKEAPTSSMYSGSEADASQRLFRMKMFGRDRRSLTLWKNCFSWMRGKTSVKEGLCQPRPCWPVHSAGSWECGERQRMGYRLHQSGLRVGHQHKHVGIQAKLVNPAVQLCGDIDARAGGDRGKPSSDPGPYSSCSEQT